MKPRLLVVEDEENVRESVAALLEVEGYDVATADNGAQALSILRNDPDPFAAVILDLMMPQVDGWAFRARQRKQPAISDIPVVVLSGVDKLHRELEDLEPAAVLQKPVSVNELLATLDEILLGSTS